jgi:hypothetical protein
MADNQDTDLPPDPPRPWINWKPSYRPYETNEHLNERDQADDAYLSHTTRQPQPKCALSGIDCMREYNMVKNDDTPSGVSATLVTALDVSKKRPFARMPLRMEFSNKSSFKMHLSKTHMNHPGDDSFVVPATTGHVFRLNASNLGGADMVKALFQDESRMEGCTVWGDWIPFIPGDTKKAIKDVCVPLIKKSANPCAEICDSLISGWFHEKVDSIGSVKPLTHAKTVAQNHLTTVAMFPRRLELINCHINQSNLGANRINHLFCEGCKFKLPDKVFEKCIDESFTDMNLIRTVPEKLNKWNHFCVAVTKIVGETDLERKRVRGGQKVLEVMAHSRECARQCVPSTRNIPVPIPAREGLPRPPSHDHYDVPLQAGFFDKVIGKDLNRIITIVDDPNFDAGLPFIPEKNGMPHWPFTDQKVLPLPHDGIEALLFPTQDVLEHHTVSIDVCCSIL